MSGLTPELKDKLTKVCLCTGVSRATMKKVIANGADSLEKVQEATGAGSGSCKGRRCSPKILELLDSREEY